MKRLKNTVDKVVNEAFRKIIIELLNNKTI